MEGDPIAGPRQHLTMADEEAGHGVRSTLEQAGRVKTIDGAPESVAAPEGECRIEAEIDRVGNEHAAGSRKRLR